MLAPARPPVLILGSHRSGTSALTERLAALGLFVGARLDSHSESAFFQRVNRRLTSEAGGHWTTPLVVAEALARIEDLASFAAPVRSLVAGPTAREYWGFGLRPRPQDAPWGWKDPRNTYLVALWAALFPGMPIISMQRDPRACALSLHVRTTALRAQFADAADGTTHRAEQRAGTRAGMRSLRGRPILADGWRTATLAGAVDVALEYRELQVGLTDRHPNVLTVEYEELVADPEGVLAMASRHCGLVPSPEQIRSLASSITPSANAGRADGVELTDEQCGRLARLGYRTEK